MGGQLQQVFSILSGRGVRKGREWGLNGDKKRFGTTFRGCRKTLKHTPGTKGCPAELGNCDYATYSVITDEATIPCLSNLIQLQAYYNALLVLKKYLPLHLKRMFNGKYVAKQEIQILSNRLQ